MSVHPHSSNVRTGVEPRWKAMHWLSQREPIRGPNWVDTLMWVSLSRVTAQCAIGPEAMWRVEGERALFEDHRYGNDDSYHNSRALVRRRATECAVEIRLLRHLPLKFPSGQPHCCHQSAIFRSVEIGWEIEPNDTFQHRGMVPRQRGRHWQVFWKCV